jgi:hypothetical protein
MRTHLVQEDGTDTRFRNVDSLNSDAGVIPKRKYSRSLFYSTYYILSKVLDRQVQIPTENVPRTNLTVKQNIFKTHPSILRKY